MEFLNRMCHTLDAKLFPEVHPEEDDLPAAAVSSEEEDPEPEGRTGPEEVRRCVVCLQENLNRERVYAFLPCGHSRTCQSCGDELMAMNAHCPECRAFIVTRQTIYI